IAMLKQEKPGTRRRILGTALLGVLAAGAGLSAWGAQPPQVRVVKIADPQPEPQQSPSPSPSQAQAQTQPDASPYQRLIGSYNYRNGENLPIYLRGRVERIDFRASTYVIYLRANNIARHPAEQAIADSRLWELPPINYFGDPQAADAIRKSLANQKIEV